MFPCDCCGCCCRNLDRSELYINLNRGDGVCKYLSGNYCAIYDERPLLCRVDECYDLFFSQIMNLDEYYRLNKKECQNLKKMEG